MHCDDMTCALRSALCHPPKNIFPRDVQQRRAWQHQVAVKEKRKQRITMMNDMMKNGVPGSFIESLMQNSNQSSNFKQGGYAEMFSCVDSSNSYPSQSFADALFMGTQGMEFEMTNLNYSSFDHYNYQPDFLPSPRSGETSYYELKNQNHNIWPTHEKCASNISQEDFMPHTNLLKQQEHFLQMFNQDQEPQYIFQIDQEAINKELQQQMLHNLMKQMFLPQHQANSICFSAPPSPASSFVSNLSTTHSNYCCQENIPSNVTQGVLPIQQNSQSPQQHYSNEPSPVYSSYTDIPSPTPTNYSGSLGSPTSPNMSLNYSSCPSPQSSSLTDPHLSNSEEDEVDCMDKEMLINTFKTLAEFVNNENIKTTGNSVSKVKPRKKRARKGNGSSTGKPRLYNFLHEILDDPSNYSCIEWVDKSSGLFKFLDSAQVARLWGFRKNKPWMKYENFARSLRTYIAKGILTKPRNKLVYCFAKPLPPSKSTKE